MLFGEPTKSSRLFVCIDKQKENGGKFMVVPVLGHS